MHPDNIEDNLRAVLRYIGEDPDREGLRDTPKRWLKAMQEMTEGRSVKVKELLEVAFDAGEYDEVVVVRGIPFTSLCEHHLLPFTGRAAVAYLPGAVGENTADDHDAKFRVVGLSKIPRLVDAFARRLQLQERLTAQIGTAMLVHLKPRGVAVLVEAEHACASCRGVRKPGMRMVTSFIRGCFRSDSQARNEVLRLLRE